MLNTIKVKNFKSIKNAKVRLPKFGGIVGRNAAGKTNLLQAVGFLKDLAVGNNTKEAQEKISLISNELFNFNDQTRGFELETTITAENNKDYLLRVKIKLLNSSIQPSQLIISQESLFLLEKTGVEKPIYHREENNLFGGNNKPLPVATEPNKMALSVYKTPHTDIVREEFRRTIIPQEDIVPLGYIGKGTRGDEAGDLANILVNLKHTQTESYEEFKVIIKKLLPHFSSIIEIPASESESSEKKSYLIVLQEENLKGKLSMQSVSSGDLKTLFLVSYGMYMKKYSNFFVEEIENGMHEKRILDLIDHLETISRVKKIQIIFTTHSPVVINFLGVHKVIYTEKTPENGTLFTFLEESEQITKIKELLKKGGRLTDYLETVQY